jgi:hypothetical protein
MLRIPETLRHLIEKRARSSDRRESDRREEDIGPLGAVLSARSMDDVPEKDRRGKKNRRTDKDRRKRGNQT